MAQAAGSWLWLLALLCLTAASTAYQELNSNKVIRASLMHRDHPESPLSRQQGAMSAGERYYASKARSARRRLAGVEFNTSISSAVAEESAEYIMTLYLGTPVQKFFLIVDTGSDLVWVQCNPCIQCFNETNPFFNPSASSSYSALPCSNLKCNSTLLGGGASCNSLNDCQILYKYGTAGSGIAGQLSTETISFDNSTKGQLAISNFLFGCMNNDTSSFGTVDGLVGFGRGPISLPSQLSTLTSVNVFSYCLVPFEVSANLTSPLVFGVSNSNALALTYTPILNTSAVITYYWVNMTGISINAMDVSIPTSSLTYNISSHFGGTIFDSGTPETRFSEDIWTIVVQTFTNLITYPIVPVSDNTSLCYNISGVQQPTYPNMTLHLSGLDGTTVDFPLTQQNLFFLNTEDVECLAIAPTGGRVGVNIIGNIAQADHYVETDLDSMKIGWTSFTDCTLPL